MYSNRIQIVLLCCCTAMLGCTRKTSSEKPRKLSTTQRASDVFDTQVTTDQRSLSGGASSTPVKEGMLPLAYVVESAATVRVVDANTGSVVATAEAPARSIVAVSTRGVTLGGTSLSSAPLSDKHKYVIFLDSAGVNEVRSTKIRSSVKD
jgi:hypothetical protein